MHVRKNKTISRLGGHPLPIGRDGRPGEGQLPSFITAQPDGATLAIKLQPRAARSAIGEPQGPELRIKVTAPPVDAAANEALLRLLADTLDCPRHQIQLLRGQTSRHKTVKILGRSTDQILAALQD